MKEATIISTSSVSKFDDVLKEAYKDNWEVAAFTDTATSDGRRLTAILERTVVQPLDLTPSQEA